MSPEWTPPLGHGPLLEGLWRSAAEGRLPHALLLRGPAGIGKFHAARWLALGLLCSEGPGPPCLACGPCKRVVSGNHPDLFLADAAADDRDVLSIHYVAHRETRSKDAYPGPAIEDFLELVAHEGGWRVVLVREAERLNEAAQNAFLKTLEEPGESVLIVLETASPAALRQTLLSRLVGIDLAPLSTADTAAILARQGLEGPRAELLTRWARGAPGQGLVLDRRGAPELLALLAQVLGGQRDPAQAASEVWELEADFPGRTALARRRARARTLLDVALDVGRETQRAAAGVPPGELVHGDLARSLARAPAALRERCMAGWLAARQDGDMNLAPEPLVDRALWGAADLAGALHGGRRP